MRTVLTLLLVATAGSTAWAQQAVGKRGPKWTGTIRGRITPPDQVKFVGAYNRRETVNPKAKMDVPETPFVGKPDERGYFQIDGLPAGTYDLVLLTTEGIRIEGFHLGLEKAYEDLLEGMADQYEEDDEPDPDELEEDEVELDEKGRPIPKKPKDKDRVIPEAVEKAVAKKIRKMRLYENKHRPLYMIGDKKRAAVLVELIRDRKTSLDADHANPFKAPIASIRYEVWTFTNWYGGWTRDRECKVLHRVIMAKADFRQRTWLWEKSLGGLKVKKDTPPANVEYEIPAKPDPAKGLTPY